MHFRHSSRILAEYPDFVAGTAVVNSLVQGLIDVARVGHRFQYGARARLNGGWRA